MSAGHDCLCTWIGYRVQHRDCPAHPVEWNASDEPFVIPDLGTPVTLLCTDDEGIVTRRKGWWRSLRKVGTPITPIPSSGDTDPCTQR